MKKSKSRGNLEDFYDLNIYKKDPNKNIPVQKKHTKSLSSILKVNDLTLEIDNKNILEKCRVEYKNAWLLKDDASINRLIDHHLDDHLQAFVTTKKKLEQSKEGDDLIDMLEEEIDQKCATIQIGNKNVDGNHKIAKEFENLFIATKDFIDKSQLQKATKDTVNKNSVKQYLMNKKVYNITTTHTNINLLKDSPDIILFKTYMLQNVLDQYCLRSLRNHNKDNGFQFDQIITTTNNTTSITTEKNTECVVIGLELIDFQLTDDKGICLSSAFAYCPMLKQINISNNQFEDHSMHFILQSIFTYTKCELLNISKNNLGHSSISYLTNYLSTIAVKQQSHSAMLQELDVSSCNLKDKYCEMLCESLHYNQTLLVLKIANNNFMLIKDQSDYIDHSDNDDNDESKEDNECINLFADIGLAINSLILTNHTLVELDISSNQLSQHTMQSLCVNIAKNRTLQRLNLSNIEFTDALAGQLGLSLHRNRHLRVIDLSNNKIYSKGAITIAYATQLKHSAITNIYLKGNPICSKGCKYLFRAMHVVASKATKSHALSTTTHHNIDHVSDSKDDEVENRQLIIDYDIINPTSTKRMYTTYDMSPDSNVVYDLNLDIHGIYELALSDPYEYTVARIIQDTAEIHPMLNFKVVKHLASSNRTYVNNSNSNSSIANKNNNHNDISKVTKSKSLSKNIIKSNNYPEELWEFIYLNRNTLVTNNNDNDSTMKQRSTISTYTTILQQYQLESSERLWDHFIPRIQSALDTLRYLNEVKQQKRLHDHQDNTIIDIKNPINTITAASNTNALGKKKHWLVNIPKPVCLADHMSTIEKHMKLSTQLKILKSNALETIMNVFKKLNIKFEQEELLKDIVQQLISCSKYNETISYSRLLNILFSSVSNHSNDCRISFQQDAFMKQQQLSNECMSSDTLHVYKKMFGIYLGSEFLPFLSFSDMVVRIISESDIYETGSGSLSRDRYMKWMLQQQMNLVPVMIASYWSLPSLQQLHTTNNSNNNVGVNNKIMSAKWMIPSHGILRLDVECTLFPDSHSANILSDKAFLTLLFSTSNLTEYNTSVLDHILIILQEMSNELHITCEQAEILLSMVLEYQQQQQQTGSHHRYSHFYLVERLSYQLISSMEVQRFLVRNLKFPEILKLRKQMGYMFLVLTGNVTGHYILHLDNSFHREVAIRLGKLSNYEKYLKLSSINSIKDLFLKQNAMMQKQINEDIQQHNIKNIVLNTSQCSSGECFRNATFNQKFIKLTSAWFQKPLPSIGILRFDFISYQKPSSYTEELYAINANHIQPIGLKINDSISDNYDYSSNTNNIFTNSYGKNNNRYSNNELANNKADGEVMSVDVLLDILFDKKVIKRKTFMMSRLHRPIVPTNRKSAFVKRFKNVISISKLNTIHVTNNKLNTGLTLNQNNCIAHDNEDSDSSHETTVEDNTATATAVTDDCVILNQEDLLQQWSDFAYTSFKTYRNKYLETLKKRFNLALKEECAKPVVGYINRLAQGEIPAMTYQHESYLHIRNLPIYKAISLTTTTLHANMSSYRNTVAANHSERDLSSVHTPHPNINNNVMNTNNNITSTAYSNTNSEDVMNNTTFEIFFQRLEVVLLYQTWFTIPQVKSILQYLYERKNASVRVLTRCLCILYNRIIHHENIYELFQICDHYNNNISSTIPHRTATSTVAGSTGISSPTRLKTISKTNSNKLNIRSISAKKVSTNEPPLISTNTILYSNNSNSNNPSIIPSYHALLAHDSSFYFEVIHRLGVLNVINLNQPESRYELDLASTEDRNAVKLLAILAVIFKTCKWTNVIFYKESIITPPVILTTLLLKYINNLPFDDYITTHRNNNNYYSTTTSTNIGMGNNNNKSHMEYINNINIQNKTLPHIYNPPIQWCKEDPEGPPKYGHLHFTITQ